MFLQLLPSDSPVLGCIKSVTFFKGLLVTSVFVLQGSQPEEAGYYFVKSCSM